jgi:hypothetical protein
VAQSSLIHELESRVAELRVALTEAERRQELSHREMERLHQRLADVQEERDRLAELLKLVLRRPERHGKPVGERVGQALKRLQGALRGALEALRRPASPQPPPDAGQKE